MNFHDIAKKAHGGDREALTLLIIEAPKGMMGDKSPEEFAKHMSEDKSACEKMSDMEYTSKNAFDAYAEEHGDPVQESGDFTAVGSDIKVLLDNWTERDPSTPAGKYYEDLKSLYEKQYETYEDEASEE